MPLDPEELEDANIDSDEANVAEPGKGPEDAQEDS